METKNPSGDRLEFHHDGVAGSRLMLWIVIGCVVAVALATFLGGSWVSLVIVLVIGAFFIGLLRRSSAVSTAVFDKTAGTVIVTHGRDGKEIEREERPIGEISRVIVEAAGRSAKIDRKLELRPALVTGETILPLTFRAFVGGDSAIEAAKAIRRFLGHADDGLFEDSVAAMAKHTDRVNPAVRLARLGMGMGRLEAARYVTRLRDEG